MNIIDVYRGIAWAEARFPVAELAFGDAILWPLLRDLFARPFVAHRQQAYRRMTGVGSHVDPLAGSRAVPRIAKEDMHVRVSKSSELGLVTVDRLSSELHETAAGAVLQFHAFRDYNVVTGEGCISRMNDAFAELAAPTCRTVKLVPLTKESLAAKFARPTTQLVEAGGRAVLASVDGEEAIVARTCEIASAAGAAGLAVENVPGLVRHRLRAFAWKAEQYQRLLDDLQPSAVQITSYSTLERMAMVTAAWRTGIPSIDVQHGFMGDVGPYVSLDFAGSAGTETLPSDFWCWGQDSFDAVERSLGTSLGRHRPVLGGSPEHLVVASTPDGSKVDRLPDALRAARASYDRVALFCWQPDMLVHEEPPSLLPSKLLEAMAASQRVLFLIRLHPRSLHLIPLFERVLVDHGLTNVEVSATSLAPLSAVLDVANVLLTSYSTVAFEANERGIPVILVDKVGQAMMRRYIERGAFHGANETHELVSLIGELGPADAPTTMFTSGTVRDFTSALAGVLNRPTTMNSRPEQPARLSLDGTGTS